MEKPEASNHDNPKQANQGVTSASVTMAEKYITLQGGSQMLLCNLGAFCTFVYLLP